MATGLSGGPPVTIVGPLDTQGNVKTHEQGTANVAEQNLDGSGNIRVHEQGTANVNVTNGSIAVAPATPVTGGGGFAIVQATSATSPGTQIASAVAIHLASAVNELVLRYQGSVVAHFIGPDLGGNDSIVLDLARPIEFDQIECFGIAGNCTVGWVGAQP
jgi:hypothetical protein